MLCVVFNAVANCSVSMCFQVLAVWWKSCGAILGNDLSLAILAWIKQTFQETKRRSEPQFFRNLHALWCSAMSWEISACRKFRNQMEKVLSKFAVFRNNLTFNEFNVLDFYQMISVRWSDFGYIIGLTFVIQGVAIIESLMLMIASTTSFAIWPVPTL